MNLKLLTLARSANGVKRYHTVTNVNTPETVGHHTCGVIGILFAIYDQKPPLKLIEAALYHDTPEYVTGDTPATAKWDFPAISDALTDAEAEVTGAVGYLINLLPSELMALKFADIMDLIFKCRMESQLGNREMHAIMLNGIQFTGNLLREQMPEFNNAHNMFTAFLQEMQDESE